MLPLLWPVQRLELTCKVLLQCLSSETLHRLNAAGYGREDAQRRLT